MYKVLSHQNNSPEELEKELNNMSEQGYELVDIIVHNFGLWKLASIWKKKNN
jgi:hypothetical protein